MDGNVRALGSSSPTPSCALSAARSRLASSERGVPMLRIRWEVTLRWVILDGRAYDVCVDGKLWFEVSLLA